MRFGHYNRFRHPIQEYRLRIYRPIRSFVERGRKGWSVQDTWSLDTYISRVIAEALDHMRHNNISYPGNATPEEWDAILADMSSGFRRWASHFDDPNEVEAYQQVRRSIRLMHRWFSDLWD